MSSTLKLTTLDKVIGHKIIHTIDIKKLSTIAKIKQMFPENILLFDNTLEDTKGDENSILGIVPDFCFDEETTSDIDNVARRSGIGLDSGTRRSPLVHTHQTPRLRLENIDKHEDKVHVIHMNANNSMQSKSVDIITINDNGESTQVSENNNEVVGVKSKGFKEHGHTLLKKQELYQLRANNVTEGCRKRTRQYHCAYCYKGFHKISSRLYHMLAECNPNKCKYRRVKSKSGNVIPSKRLVVNRPTAVAVVRPVLVEHDNHPQPVALVYPNRH